MNIISRLTIFHFLDPEDKELVMDSFFLDFGVVNLSLDLCFPIPCFSFMTNELYMLCFRYMLNIYCILGSLLDIINWKGAFNAAILLTMKFSQYMVVYFNRDD